MRKSESASASVRDTLVQHRHACTATMTITPTRARLTGTTDLIISSAECSSAPDRGSTAIMGRAVTATTVAVITAAEAVTTAAAEVATTKAVEAGTFKAVEEVTSKAAEAVISAAEAAARPMAVVPMVAGPTAADTGKRSLFHRSKQERLSADTDGRFPFQAQLIGNSDSPASPAGAEKRKTAS